MSKSVHILSSEESELLLAFESASSLEKIAEAIGKDISNVSRSLTKISEKLPVVEKQNNRWQLTDLGKRLNERTRDSIQFQKTLVNQQNFLRIGTNREFASRILGSRLQELIELFPNTQLRICAFEAGVENALLNGQVDIGIDCERPFSPDISYKICLTEDIIAVCAPKFKKMHLKDLKDGEFFNQPHLLCDRLYPDRIFKKLDNKLNVIASFNDIATTRAACLEGFAWALLPRYTVQTELDLKSLVQIDYPNVGQSNYGVWWARTRKSIEPSALKLKDWLKNSDFMK
ncbi:MAG: LysR family transcriptional regulator [Bdellovibrionota bacterium]